MMGPPVAILDVSAIFHEHHVKGRLEAMGAPPQSIPRYGVFVALKFCF